jgi:hypothetical protein
VFMVREFRSATIAAVILPKGVRRIKPGEAGERCRVTWDKRDSMRTGHAGNVKKRVDVVERENRPCEARIPDS